MIIHLKFRALRYIHFYHFMRIINFFTASAVILSLLSCSKKEPSPSLASVHNVFVTSPQTIGLESEISLPATVEEARTISIGFKTAGQIERIYVKEGDCIVTGSVIAQLDTTDYHIGISALREKYAQVSAEIDRITKLHASGNVSDNDFEKATSGLRQLSLQLQLEENKLAYCTLRAPSSGIVTKVHFEASEMVDAGTHVIELMDNSSLEAIVDLPVKLYSERDLFSAFYGESSLNPGKLFPLRMLSLTPVADNNQLYRLRLSMPASLTVTAGMNITVHIFCEGAKTDMVKVPLSSVFEDNGNRYVWVVNPEDSTVSATEVTISGTGEDGFLHVSSGLSTDDIIVRAGVHHLVDGEKVTILIEESETNPGNVL